MPWPERSVAPERSIRAQRAIGAERTIRTARPVLRRPVRGRPVRLWPVGRRRLGLARLRLGRPALRWMRRRRLRRGRGLGPLAERGHRQPDNRAGNEQAQEGRQPGKAFLRRQHVVQEAVADGGRDDLSRGTVSAGRAPVP
jgi:hypothetical protein